MLWSQDTPAPMSLRSTKETESGKTLAASRDESAEKLTEQRLRILLDVNNAIVTKLSQDELLRAVCTALQGVLPFNRSAITLYVPERDTLRIFAQNDEYSSEFFSVGRELDRMDSHAGWAFDHQRPLIRRNLDKESESSTERLLAQQGVRSICVAPLIIAGKSIGTLNLASNQADQYSNADGELLQEVANQVALAVENTQAYEEIRALHAKLEKENVYLREEIRSEHDFREIVGGSAPLREVLERVERVAPLDTTVLIYGETGTGKELIARAIHDRSNRKNRPLVKLNCSAISAGLVESELFGHMRGAFTGALERHIGRFELADGGTLFLDEVSELALETQVKLLRVLQEGEFEPVGSNKTIQVNVRNIAATNRNLEELVTAGRFRSDLFYRLNVFPLELPPLRDRRSDIPQLVMFFLERFANKFGKKIDTVQKETMDLLMDYDWPGNIRELQNIIERAVVLATRPVLFVDPAFLPRSSTPGELRQASSGVPPRPDSHTTGNHARLAEASFPSLEQVERNHILAALNRSGGVIDGPKGAARILNLHPNTLRSKMNKLGIDRRHHDIS
jgi:formate hydrogenlyase transcriptional activator